MKKILIILISVLLLIGIAVVLINKPQPIITPINSVVLSYPYINNNILYTEKRALPLEQITTITVDNRTVRYVVFTWSDGKYKGGIFSMSMLDFEKIRPQLERYYATKKR